MLIAVIFACFTGLISFGLGWFLRRSRREGLKKQAQSHGEILVDEAKVKADELMSQVEQDAQELEQKLWAEVELSFEEMEDAISQLEKVNKIKKRELDLKHRDRRRDLDSHCSQVQKLEDQLAKLESKHQRTFEVVEQLRADFIAKLCERTGRTQQEVVESLSADLIQEAERDASRRATYLIDEELKEDADARARRIFDIVLDRFQRPYCPERGLSSVSIPNEKVKEIFFGDDPECKTAVEELCGCDLVLYEENQNVGIAGFDPVRREHTRRTLERIFKDKKITVERVRKHAADKKRELFKQIQGDGNRLAKELSLEGLHPEVRQMMGSLRYRYSFTQNQYFHCAEVGWLCGLLASELEQDIPAARRSGMLHDIGKSMDHAMDGGHATIGADFISARGEEKEIVHAVRAHHFDEQPSSNIAFLVIAADAISGARPGARRSTMESYTQKVNELDAIARSFEGVQDCFILSGGREVRVIADGHRINDLKAVEMSHAMASKIEAECNYPGQIRVVVVRETIAVEHTRDRARAH